MVALGGIELPVGVSGKAGGGVQGEIGTDIGEPLGIEGQDKLHALDAVGEEHAGCREAEHGKGVLAPVHLVVGVDGAELVEEPLKGAQHGVKPSALAFEHACDVDAHRAHGRKQDDAVDSKLQPTISGHVRISPGRAG